jgi:uncharacterized coiled-coil protein SlyX
MKRVKIDEDEPIAIPFTARERTLIVDHVFPDPRLGDRLVKATEHRGRLLASFTVYDIEELCDSVAAKANHTKDKRLQGELRRLFERLKDLMERYDDGNWQTNL